MKLFPNNREDNNQHGKFNRIYLWGCIFSIAVIVILGGLAIIQPTENKMMVLDYLFIFITVMAIFAGIYHLRNIE